MERLCWPRRLYYHYSCCVSCWLAFYYCIILLIRKILRARERKEDVIYAIERKLIYKLKFSTIFGLKKKKKIIRKQNHKEDSDDDDEHEDDERRKKRRKKKK